MNLRGPRIVLDPRHANENATRAAYWAFNLLARLHPQVALEIPRDIPAPPGIRSSGTLHSALASLRTSLPAPPSTQACLSTLRITPDGPQHTGEVTCWADGWTIWVNVPATKSWDHSNPVSAAAAGAAAVAALHNAGSRDTPEGYAASLRDYSPTPDAGAIPAGIEVPSFLLAGVGAVGSSFTLALGGCLPRGTAHLVDPQRLSPDNLRRYLLNIDVDVGREKAIVAAEYLNSTGLKAKGHVGPGRAPLTKLKGDVLLVSAVDTAPGRRALARCLPRFVLDGAVEGTRLEVVTASFPPAGPCLSCFYPADQTDHDRSYEIATAFHLPTEEVQEMRAEGSPVTLDLLQRIEEGVGLKFSPDLIGENLDTLYGRRCGAQVAATIQAEQTQDPAPTRLVPFAPAMAGILLSGQLVRIAMGERLQAGSFFLWDLAGRPWPDLHRVRHPIEGCEVCSDPDFRAVFQRRYDDRELPQSVRIGRTDLRGNVE